MFQGHLALPDLLSRCIVRYSAPPEDLVIIILKSVVPAQLIINTSAWLLLCWSLSDFAEERHKATEHFIKPFFQIWLEKSLFGHP